MTTQTKHLQCDWCGEKWSDTCESYDAGKTHCPDCGNDDYYQFTVLRPPTERTSESTCSTEPAGGLVQVQAEGATPAVGESPAPHDTVDIVRRRLADGRTIADIDVHRLVEEIDRLRSWLEYVRGNHREQRECAEEALSGLPSPYQVQDDG